MFVAQSAVKIWRVRSVAFSAMCRANNVPFLLGSHLPIAHREHIAENASKLLGSRVH